MSKYSSIRFLFILIGLFITSIGQSQTPLFTENFDEAFGATSGSSVEGVNWTATCPGCAASSDWFRVNNSGQLEGRDVNAPSAKFITDNIDVSNYCYVTINISYESQGTLEDCSSCSGCNCDPDNPNSACEGIGGQGCWDYIFAKVNFGGTIFTVDFVDAGTGGNLSAVVCVEGANMMNIQIDVSTTAGSEYYRINSVEATGLSCSYTDAGVANVMCNDNGTPNDDTDDYITFDLNPTGENLENSFYDINGNNQTGGYDVSGDITGTGMYGSTTSFQTAPGTAGMGDLSLTIADKCDTDLMLSNVTVADPGVCSTPACEAPTGSPMITESECSTGCTPANGTIAVGTLSCASGSLEYSTDNGSTWSSTLPSYDQTTSVSFIARCNCASASQSTATSAFTTTPGTCTDPAAPTGGMITNSSCQSDGATISGGSFTAPTCATGTLYWSETSGSGFSTTEPTYSQEGPAQTIYTICVDVNGCESPEYELGTTVPGMCSACDAPTGSPMITESECSTGCTPANGTIAVGTLACASGSLEYSTDNGSTWSGTLPSYDQTTSVSFIARCNCASASQSTATSAFMTTPGTCTDPAAPTGGMITNSSCQSDGATVSGGSFTAPTCATGTLHWSETSGSGFSTTEPTYSQEGPAQTIYTICVDGNGCESPEYELGTTVPGECLGFTITNTFSATDPCSCTGDGSTFSEIVTVTGNAGVMVRLADDASNVVAGTNITLPAMLTETNAGEYTLEFTHTDLQGYDFQLLEYSEDGGTTWLTANDASGTPLAFSNVCTYPTIMFDDIADQFCNDEAAVTLSGSQTNTLYSGGGAFTFSGDGVSGTMFDPASITQSMTIEIMATYTPVDGTGAGGTAANPATAINASMCPLEEVQSVMVNVPNCGTFPWDGNE